MMKMRAIITGYSASVTEPFPPFYSLPPTDCLTEITRRSQTVVLYFIPLHFQQFHNVPISCFHHPSACLCTLLLQTTPFPHTLGARTMAATDDGCKAERFISGREEFGNSSNTFSAILAMALWLGAIHFNIALIVFALFFLPLPKLLLFVFYLSPNRRFSFFLFTLIEFCCLACQGFRFSVCVCSASHRREE